MKTTAWHCGKEYDGRLLDKVKEYFNKNAGREVVVDCNEWIVEAGEQKKEVQEAAAWESKSGKRPAKVIAIEPPTEAEPTRSFERKEGA